jgi:polysaccharide biosynthesis/export protein
MMRSFFLVMAAMVVSVLSAGLAAAQDTYRIRPGDVLRVEVLEDGSLNRDTLVRPDGQISVPLVGTVGAGGRTISDVQADLTAKLSGSFATAPSVFVTIASLAERQTGTGGGTAVARTIDVFVVGEAGAQGKVEVKPRTTLLQLFAQMGGFGPFAATKRIQLHRTAKDGSTNIYTYSYDQILAGGAGGATRLQAGDVIVVPQRRLFE